MGTSVLVTVVTVVTSLTADTLKPVVVSRSCVCPPPYSWRPAAVVVGSATLVGVEVAMGGMAKDGLLLSPEVRDGGRSEEKGRDDLDSTIRWH